MASKIILAFQLFLVALPVFYGLGLYWYPPDAPRYIPGVYFGTLIAGIISGFSFVWIKKPNHPTKRDETIHRSDRDPNTQDRGPASDIPFASFIEEDSDSGSDSFSSSLEEIETVELLLYLHLSSPSKYQAGGRIQPVITEGTDHVELDHDINHTLFGTPLLPMAARDQSQGLTRRNKEG